MWQLEGLQQRGVDVPDDMTKREASQAFLRLLVRQKMNLTGNTPEAEALEFVPATNPQILYLQSLIKQVRGVSNNTADKSQSATAAFLSELESKIESGSLNKLDVSSHIDKLKDLIAANE